METMARATGLAASSTKRSIRGTLRICSSLDQSRTKGTAFQAVRMSRNGKDWYVKMA